MATPVSRRQFLGQAAGLAAGIGAMGARQVFGAEAAPPNLIVIFTDDQGYADLSCYGAPEIRTPRIDQMAAEGMRFTDFYTAAPVCTPARAALLTGCYAQRIGMAMTPREGDRLGHVLFPNSYSGLHPDEVTIATMLKQRGYATGCVGKWHLGHLPPFLPTYHGFDEYYGIPYSNDMVPCPILRGEEIVEMPAQQETLTERYTDEAVRFIRDHAAEPFFLYLAHNMPHVPLYASDRFRNTSDGGLYGDVIETIDWSTGQILDTLSELGLANNTLVVFTCDNGPWLVKGPDAGLATPLRAGKGTTYEGGMRVPCVAWWPGQVPAGTECTEMATTMDLLPTVAALTGAQAPQDRVIDGKDIRPLLFAEPGATTPHEALFYYFGNDLHAVRSGDWKLRLENIMRHEDIYFRWPEPDAKTPEALYNLRTDIGEQKNLINHHPDIAERLHSLIAQAREDIGDARLGVKGKNTRPCGEIDPEIMRAWLEKHRT